MGVSSRKAYQLAQNEGARVRKDATVDCIKEAKKKGADLVKMWDATMDSKTRPIHAELHGKWAEVDEKFEYSGGEVFAPKEFGVPALDINCRCALLSVPRWDVDDNARHYDNAWRENGNDKMYVDVKNYEDWKRRYYDSVHALENNKQNKVYLNKELYPNSNDKESVTEFVKKVKEQLDISYVSGIEKLTTGEVCNEMINEVARLGDIYGKQFSKITIVDYERLIVAETNGSELRINSTFANRPEALKELLNAWENQNYIPRGCNNVQYVSDHEYYHLLTVPLIDGDPKFVTMLKRAKKNGIEANSDNGINSIYEYVADMLCEKKTNNKQQRLKDDIIRYVKGKGK